MVKYLIIPLFLLAFAGSLQSISVECFMDAKKVCDIFPMPSFPETADELKEVCTSLILRGNCFERIIENCPNEEEETVAFFKTTVKYITEVCEEDSSVFPVISENLPCIKKSVAVMQSSSHDICSLYSLKEKNRKLLLSEGEQLMEADNHVNERTLHCMYDYGDVFCRSFIVGHNCGTETRDAVYDILKNIDEGYMACSEETIRDIESMNNVLTEVILDELKSRETADEEE